MPVGRESDRDTWKQRDRGSRLSWEVVLVWTRKSDVGSRLGGTMVPVGGCEASGRRTKDESGVQAQKMGKLGGIYELGRTSRQHIKKQRHHSAHKGP